MSPTSRFVNSVIFSAGFIFASQLYGEQQDLVPYAQEQQGNYELAIEGYSSLIDELEATGGLFSPDLIDPLLGLARSHLALKDLEAAEDSAARAQHVQHRNEGVLSLDQLAAVDIKTKIHLLNGVPTRADKQQRFAFYLAERNYGADSLDALPAKYKLVDWYTATGQYFKAQRLLSETIKSFSETEKHALVILPALLRSARLRRLRGIAGQHKHLESALAIVTDNPEIPRERQLEVFLALADAYLVSNRFTDAKKFYQRTWDEMDPTDRYEQFSEPKELALSNALNESQSNVFSASNASNIRRLRPTSREYRSLEQLYEEQDSDQQKLVLPFQQDDYSVLFNQNSTDPTASKTFKVVGEPFRFVRKQLVDLLPSKLKSDEGLATIAITMSFSVSAEGKTGNIKASSEQASGRLLRTMRKILAKTRFRPRLVEGKPAATDNVKLTQTFQTPSV